MASTVPTAAVDTFLGTPELLEALFLQCDMRSLLVSAQRVCKNWHEIITKTPSVQVHLFMRPVRTTFGAPASSTVTLNPLLAELFPPFFTPFETAVKQGFCTRSDIEGLPLAAKQEPFLYHDASWRNMLVQQPPLTSMGVSMPETDYSVVYYRREDMVRMWDLYDMVVRGVADPGLQWVILWKPRVHQARQDMTGGCTAKLMSKTDLILVRRRDQNHFLGWTHFRSFHGKFVNPKWLGAQTLERAPSMVVTGTPSRNHRREL